ncbi:MAG: hypothetical protein PHE50_10095, partial [Dehalococcoidales bacterium]|nr:hypothetical protein [Dehalococcoidales bacterium]
IFFEKVPRNPTGKIEKRLLYPGKDRSSWRSWSVYFGRTAMPIARTTSAMPRNLFIICPPLIGAFYYT